MTSEQRRITLAVCLVAGLSLLMAAGVAFLVTPMAQSLELSDAVVEDMLAMPSVAALLMVFSAGQLGDRIGARRSLMLASIAFSIGALFLAFAGTEYPVEIGLAICAAAAVTVQIVGVSLLQQVTGSGRAQVLAFTTYGMVFPASFLVFPVVTAWLLEVLSWRVVAVIWVGAGLVMLLIIHFLVRPEQSRKIPGEWLTPLLAGVALAGVARAIAELEDMRIDPIPVLISLVVGILAALACWLIMRGTAAAQFSLSPIRGNGIPWFLIAVGLVVFSGLLTYVSIAIEYLYEMTPHGAAVVVMPAQIASIIGARILAKRVLERWSGVRGARILALALAVSTVPVLLLQVQGPLWYLVAATCLFSFVWMGLLTVLNAETMRRAPAGHTGAVSSFRTAASAFGGAVGVGILGTIVISAIEVKAGVTSMSLEQMADVTGRLRIDGVLAMLAALACWGILGRGSRQESSDDTKGADAGLLSE